jgi:signal transduction histidine kinase
MDDGRLMFAFTHDLRTHLRTILTRIQLVQRSSGAALTDEERSMLGEAEKAVGDIGGLLDSMLAFSTVQSSDSVTKLGLVLQGALLERKTLLQQCGGQVEVSNDLDVTVPSALQGVLKELLTNACKFRDKSQPLRIQIRTQVTAGENLEIVVTDNGVSANPADLEKIFLPFHRLHPRDEFEGHGLGLATCRRIAAAWDGSIVAEITAQGGFAVRVTVPAPRLALG